MITNQDQIITKRLEEIARDFHNTITSKEKELYDADAKSFIDFFISDKEEYKRYFDFYEEKKNENR
jgi:hypothetical protein